MTNFYTDLHIPTHTNSHKDYPILSTFLPKHYIDKHLSYIQLKARLKAEVISYSHKLVDFDSQVGKFNLMKVKKKLHSFFYTKYEIKEIASVIDLCYNPSRKWMK